MRLILILILMIVVIYHFNLNRNTFETSILFREMILMIYRRINTLETTYFTLMTKIFIKCDIIRKYIIIHFLDNIVTVLKIRSIDMKTESICTILVIRIFETLTIPDTSFLLQFKPKLLILVWIQFSPLCKEKLSLEGAIRSS